MAICSPPPTTSARTLRLIGADRCLNIMPLFHIHGLVAAMLASSRGGGSVFCTPGFNALKFFALDGGGEAQLVHGGAHHAPGDPRARRRNEEIIKAHPLRFIRSSSASLPVPVFHALEAAFGCPVIEAYAMTENAHQMTVEPIAARPSASRASSAVRRGPKWRSWRPMADCSEPGEEGEVVTRGPNVTHGLREQSRGQ